MAETESAVLKSREYYIGVEPGTSNVYYDRTHTVPGGGWERVELTKLANGFYTVRFEAANVMLSLQPNGTFQTRPAGTSGPWEQVAGGKLESGPQAGLRILGPFKVESV